MLCGSSGACRPEMAVGQQVDHSVVECTAGLIDESIRMDSNCDLADTLRLNNRMDLATFSGSSEADYPRYDSFGMPSIREFSIVRRTPVPQEIIDVYARLFCLFGHFPPAERIFSEAVREMQTTFKMGLLPAIRRAYVAIDSDLYVWNYETCGDLATMIDIRTCIQKVAVAVPRPGVFEKDMQYILVVATATEVRLYALTFTDIDGEQVEPIECATAEMHMMGSPLFTVSMDGCQVEDIASTTDGRIFLAANNSCLFELEYSRSGWFKPTCKKVNRSHSMISMMLPSVLSWNQQEALWHISIDHSRHILYTLSKKGTIQVYDLGADGTDMRLADTVYLGDIRSRAMQTCPSLDMAMCSGIVCIQALQATQSRILSLVAVTSSGVRLYFTVYSADFYDRLQQQASQSNTDIGSVKVSQGVARPGTLRLAHVRLPPMTPNANCPRIGDNNINNFTANVDKDSILLFKTEDPNSTSMWMFSSACMSVMHPRQVNAVMPESTQHETNRGRGRAIWSCVTDRHGVKPKQLAASSAFLPPLSPPFTTLQHRHKTRKYTAISSHEVLQIERLRPLDILKQILIDHGPDSHACQSFAAMQGPDEFCTWCIELACMGCNEQSVVYDRALRALAINSGEPMLTQSVDPRLYASNNQTYMNVTYGNHNVEHSMSRLNQPPVYASTPYHPNRPTAANGFDQSMSMMLDGGTDTRHIYSHKHNALYSTFSRVVSQLWSKPIAYLKMVDKQETLVSTFDLPAISKYIDELRALVSVMEQACLVPQPLATMHNDDPTTKATLSAQNAECRSLNGLKHVVDRSVEMLHLFKCILEHNFGHVTACLPREIKHQVAAAPFKHLCVGGKLLLTDLISCLVQYYLGDQAATDVIAKRLRQACPTLYTDDDVTSTKASELLTTATGLADGDSKRDALLNEAVQLYKRVVHQVHLLTVCAQLRNARHYSGIIDLCVCAAEKADPRNLAVNAYRNRHLANMDVSFANTSGVRGANNAQQSLRNIFDRRRECYHGILDTLDHLLAPASRHGTNRDANFDHHQGNAMLLSAFKTNDELLQMIIFDWMVERNKMDKFFEVKSTCLEQYLQDKIRDTEDKASFLTFTDLLWKYYEKNNKFDEAAELLQKLAETDNPNVNLAQRVSYLTTAHVCAKSASSIDERVIADVSDKLEVARLQLDISNDLRQLQQSRARRDRSIADALSNLNAGLFDLNTLYNDYCSAFELYEMQLRCMACACIDAEHEVDAVWVKIIDRELHVPGTESVDARCQRLYTKLRLLYQTYKTNTKYYPTGLIARVLAQKAVDMNVDANWLPQIIDDIGIPFVEMLMAIEQTCNAPDQMSSRRAQSLMYNMIINMLNTFVQSSRKGPQRRNERIAMECIELVSRCVFTLESACNLTDEQSQARMQLHALQPQLEAIAP